MGKNPFGRAIPAVLSAALALSLSSAALAAEPDAAGQDAAAPNWGEGNVYAPENTVMVHIRRIREKIELNPKEPEYVKVVWGLGYKLEKH